MPRLGYEVVKCQICGCQIKSGASICSSDWRIISVEQRNERSQGKTKDEVIAFLKSRGRFKQKQLRRDQL